MNPNTDYADYFPLVLCLSLSSKFRDDPWLQRTPGSEVSLRHPSATHRNAAATLWKNSSNCHFKGTMHLNFQWKSIWGPGLEFNMEHNMPHALRPPGRHSQGETIPDHSNDSHKLKPQTKDGASPTPLQSVVTNFSFNTLSIFLPYFWVRPTP